MSEYKCCRYCGKGVYIPVDRKIMCAESGMVPRDHYCPKFVFDPFKIKTKRMGAIDFSKYKKEDFSIE